ncbi:YhcH/YjgK/YiaL family protein [Aeromonas enteropelogenes]|uniref:YhcH/YjgK/YiaL family protein n=1 Tax=Aeromonas enteropelogenes TaxID=29489 RepID=UPI003B9E238E
MIIGHLNALPLAGLPSPLRQILSRSDCSLQALSALDDGCWQPDNCRWFCNVGSSKTQIQAQRHTEYHHQWVDIQVVLSGCELIYAGMRSVEQDSDEERKPDLFITNYSNHEVAITLRAGDFACFFPGEPHQALCSIGAPMVIRKAVFKVPRDLLET